MFLKNKIYKRSDIHDKYGGNRQRGISNCVEHPLIFIFTNPNSDEQDVYVDEWKNKYFYYSGEGRKGDMKMTGGNKSILDHQKNKKEIHLFEKTSSSGMWKYIDQLKLVDRNDYRNKDEDGNERDGFQFVLLSVSEEIGIKEKVDSLPNIIEYNYNLPNKTERKGLVTTRIGQGIYRKMILQKWDDKCGVTGCNIKNILISSHIVPWKDSNKSEKRDPENGILLSPNLDSLFDRHLISFDDSGDIIISKKLLKEDLDRLGVNEKMKLSQVTDGMKPYLKRHRDKFYSL